MNSFLMIQNVGAAPKESFTLFGASSKRKSDNPLVIGTFGTGGKQAIAKLLRDGLSPIIFSSLLKMDWLTKQENVHDGLKSNVYNRICVKYSGKEEAGNTLNRTDELSVALESGASDWGSVSMALREFVSNAIDRSIEQDEYEFLVDACKGISEEDSYRQDAKDRIKEKLLQYRKTAKAYQNVVIKIVEQKEVRAKKGFTRVFVPLNEDVAKFYANVGKWFLHFSEPDALNKAILSKKDRNLDPSKKVAVIYKKGVRIREVESVDTPSLFDYNLSNLQLDESRCVDDWRVLNAAGCAMKDASAAAITQLLHSFSSGVPLWEHSFDEYALSPASYGETDKVKEVRRTNWSTAMKNLAGENAVLTSSTFTDSVKRKGHKVIQVPEVYAKSAAKIGVQTHEKVLSDDDREGRTIYDNAPQDIQECAEKVWLWLESMGKVHGKARPQVKSFDKIMDGEANMMGFYRDGSIYINNSLSSPGGSPSTELLSTVLEETAHYCTNGATDNSRDFQEFFIQICVQCMKHTLLPSGSVVQ